MDIVMLSGPQGAGKSSTARALTNQVRHTGYDGGIFYLKFAEPLYELHDAILDLMENMSGISRVAKDGPLLQYLGTDWGRRNFGENVWVDILKNRINGIKAMAVEMDKPFKKSLVIIDDCRFENEFDAFPEALRVRLNAKESVRRLRAESWRDNTQHASETALNSYELKGYFDLFIDTGARDSSPDHCATLIVAQLLKRTWNEKRKPQG